MKKKQLLIVDAHALIHRAYHALPPLTTKRGEPVGAVFGFLRILMTALADMKPAYVAVTFDSPGKTFRHDQYELYKANRDAPPEDLVSQFPLVRDAVATFGFPIYAEKGYEADDLIGTICAQFDDSAVETIILTGDMDILQLVDKDTKVMRLHKGVSESIVFDEKKVKETYGFTPAQVIDYKGLRGDTSDNIPGVRGIGEKGATQLLEEYGTLENVFAHVGEVTGRNKKPLVAEGAYEQALLSKELATIAQDAPIKFKLKDAEVGKYKQDEIRDLFNKYEFKSLIAQLNQLPGFELKEGLFAPKNEEPKKRDGFDYVLVQEPADVKKLAQDLGKQNIFAFDTETTGLNPHQDDLVGMSFSWKEGQGFYLACGPKVPAEIAAVMENPKVKKTAHNIKFDIEVLKHAGVEVEGAAFDSMLASYVVNSSVRSHGLDNLAYVEFGHEMQPITELIGKGKDQITMDAVPVEDVSWYACEDADFTWRLYEVFVKRVKEAGMEELLYDMELPTMEVLVQMEAEGITLDPEFLHDMSKTLHRRIKALEKKGHDLAGHEFNLSSPAQLQVVLFEELGIPTKGIKKTKTGFSTAASELEKLRGQHELIELIEEYRELSKLTSTYIDTLPTLINPQTGRIHTSYSQTIAATGRLSSNDPNLQNIPIRTELGREIRKAFVAPRGFQLAALDYSQIELRVVAHLAKDAVMMEAFKNGEDIHTRTAAELNDCKQEDVTKDMRRQAKAINFGILYGMGAHGIVRDSGASYEEAKFFLEKYFEVHKGIAKYIESVKEFTREHEYAETPFGRRRFLPDVNSRNGLHRSAAERAAVNMPVQGTAADLMKLAMIAVQKEIAEGKIDAKMLLQVHDELVFEIESKKADKEAKKIQQVMENVYKLVVPLVVDVEIGKNWGELKRVS